MAAQFQGEKKSTKQHAFFFNILKFDENRAVRSFASSNSSKPASSRSRDRQPCSQLPLSSCTFFHSHRKDVSFLHLLAPQRNYSRAGDCRQTAGGQTENQLVLSHELKPGLRNAEKKRKRKKETEIWLFYGSPNRFTKGKIVPVFVRRSN